MLIALYARVFEPWWVTGTRYDVVVESVIYVDRDWKRKQNAFDFLFFRYFFFFYLFFFLIYMRTRLIKPSRRCRRARLPCLHPLHIYIYLYWLGHSSIWPTRRTLSFRPPSFTPSPERSSDLSNFRTMRVLRTGLCTRESEGTIVVPRQFL